MGLRGIWEVKLIGLGDDVDSEVKERGGVENVQEAQS